MSRDWTKEGRLLPPSVWVLLTHGWGSGWNLRRNGESVFASSYLSVLPMNGIWPAYTLPHPAPPTIMPWYPDGLTYLNWKAKWILVLLSRSGQTFYHRHEKITNTSAQEDLRGCHMTGAKLPVTPLCNYHRRAMARVPCFPSRSKQRPGRPMYLSKDSYSDCDFVFQE